MKSFKHFFSTIAKMIGFDGAESNEDVIGPKSSVKKEEPKKSPGPKSSEETKPVGNGGETKRRRVDLKEKMEVQSVELQRQSGDSAAHIEDKSAKSSRMDDLSSRSLRRIRDMSERAVRKVKTFVSRPIKEATLRHFVNKVEAKMQAEQTGQVRLREVKRGDDLFPKPLRRSQEGKSKEVRTKDKVDMSLKSVATSAMRYSGGELPSGNKIVSGNKCNDGKLFINGEPFWTTKKKPTEADLEESGTEDDIQMNAEVALEVYEGKKQLVNMPSIPIILDPMNELSELKRRDKLFFCRDVLFGNSVRSMINLCDSTTKVTPIRKRGQPIAFTEPNTRAAYHREHSSESEKLPFTPSKVPSGSSQKVRKRKRTNAKTSGNGHESSNAKPGSRKQKSKSKGGDARSLSAEVQKSSQAVESS
ncbi:unnamed protein product [Cylicocyclus nassatus]|uniref:Uncharacterized protein n=1 Tax=Cylicocyclus nassatus TaxID=53992 RepID=A0AA36DPB4_CYLNA|nr:unnamed protein product [Cylicocyclus nassatus]